MLSTLMMMTTAAIAGQIDPLTHLGSLTEGLRSPARVAAAPDGTVLVADAFHKHIVHFGAGGAVLATWPVSEGPIGIAAHPDGRYFVSLRDEGTVGIYDATFARIDSLGDGQVTWSQPTDIDVDAVSGRIYVVDSGADRVYAFESGGALALMVGVRGHGSGQFRYPSAIAVDAANSRFFVADQDNFRVQAFDATTGLFQFQFGYRIKYTPTSEEGWFQRTQGLALDPSGRIYVADALMSTVRLFDGSGSEIAKVIEYGFAAGDVRTPCDLIVNSDGSRLYVASTNTASVEVYEVAPFPVPLPSGGPTEGANDSGYDRMRRGRFALHDRLGRSGVKRPQSLDGVSLGDTGIPVAQQTPDADGMHIIEEPFICARCHDVDGQPGGHLGLAEGNTVVCMSCHTAGGQALHQSIHERDLADPYGSNPLAVNGRGRSHAWGVPAVSVEADSVGPIPDSPMDQHLDSGLIKCSTCHEQHNAEPWAPYLRVNNNDDAMCKQCHAPRSEGPGQRGTHWVGFEYPAGVGEYPPAAAIAPFVLKGGDMECLTCHAVHDADSGGANDGEGDGMLLRAANDETLCKTCHTEHIGHTPSGNWQPGCPECHDVHDPDNENLTLVGAVIHNQRLATDLPVVLTARTGPNSFSDGDPAANDGVCQVCHTRTSYHQYDGTGSPHNEGQDCVLCHPHEDGFMPTGGDCTACHGVTQDNGDGTPPGGRRAVVGEFPESDMHAHYGGQLANEDCLICHGMQTHMDGYIELIDPDDGSVYRFIYPEDLTSDPDVSTFCARCHDPDGATRLPNPLNPFGQSNVPPDVATNFAGTLQWKEMYGEVCFPPEGTLRAVNSHHDIGDADQAFSGAKLECLNCHGAHTSSASQPTADPFDPLAPWTGDDNGFCLACHGGGAGPLDPGFPPGVVGPVIDVNDPDWVTLEFDWSVILGGACLTQDCSSLRGIESCDYVEGPWYVDHSWTHSAHGLDTKRDWEGYSGAPEADMDCMECHDPHGSYTPANPAGNPYMIVDFVDGTGFYDDGTRPSGFNGPPFTTFGEARTVVVPVSGVNVDWGDPDGLCEACHADWLTAYDFHGFCTGCQACHAHGAAFGENDWGPGANNTPCPIPPLPSGSESGPSTRDVSRHRGSEPGLLPLHQAAPNLTAPMGRASSGDMDSSTDGH